MGRQRQSLVAMFLGSKGNGREVSRVMLFGKHKGTILADLPGNYLNWFAREGFPEGEIGRLLALMQEIDHNGLNDLLSPLRRQQSSD